MNPHRTRRPANGLRVALTIAAPALAGAAAAIIVAVAGANGTFHFSVPLTTVLAVAGIIMSAVFGALLAVRYALRAREARGVEAGTRAEREAHRRFVARLDHELKNPVTAIRAALETDLDPSPSLRVAAGQAGRLAVLIGELRSLSALETSAIERMQVDLSAVVRDEAGAFAEDLEARGLTRVIDVQLPEAPWPLPTVAGDADLLAVAVRNLLVNAAKYSDEGSRIEVRGSEGAGYVVIEIADTGWGIADAELPHVWDELWRGGTARRVEGSGLGLSLVRIVAERHGGDVAIRSREGAGTSVRLRVPTPL